MLLLKLVLVPALIAVVTLATRRWGPRVGGVLLALPVVAGPTLVIYALQEGSAFAAAAAEATLVGLVAAAAFCVIYVHSAMRWSGPVSLIATFSLFCFALAVALPAFGLAASVAMALLLQLVLQGFLFRQARQPAAATGMAR